MPNVRGPEALSPQIEKELLLRIKNIFGAAVYQKVLEQLSSKDYQHSCCSGLVAYLLGYQPLNQSICIDLLTQLTGGGVITLRSFAGLKGDIQGQRGNSNLIFYLTPYSNFPMHVALYLGQIAGRDYEFGQWENQPPRLAPLTQNIPYEFHRVESVSSPVV